MFVSIIIPIYNVAPYVEQCIRSVLAQTYKKFEVIIVDDCGTDNSMEIVENVIADNNNPDISFRVLQHKKNRGLSAARNTGIRAAKGEYLYFLDSDDMIRKWCISLMVKLAEKYPGVDMVQGAYFSNPPKSVEWTRSPMLFPEGVEYIHDSAACRRLLQQSRHLPMVHNRLIRRSFIIDNHLYNEEGIIGEDNLWTFMVGRYIKDMAFCNIPIYGYRYRRGSIMTSGNLDAMSHGTAVLCDRILDTLPLNRWLFTELRFVTGRLEKARNMGCKDILKQMEPRNRMICSTLLFLQSMKRKTETPK